MVEIGISLAVGVICYLYGLWEGLHKARKQIIKQLQPPTPPAQPMVRRYPDASSNPKTDRMRKHG